MSRLPTLESDGKANLHKGAIGIGIRIRDGQGINPFWKGHGGRVVLHPDTGARLTDMKVPDWGEVLRIACLAQAASRLGYVGVDIVVDRKGPMVLEVNKRPGLEIQNTNLAGLLRRVEHVDRNLAAHASTAWMNGSVSPGSGTGRDGGDAEDLRHRRVRGHDPREHGGSGPSLREARDRRLRGDHHRR